MYFSETVDLLESTVLSSKNLDVDHLTGQLGAGYSLVRVISPERFTAELGGPRNLLDVITFKPIAVDKIKKIIIANNPNTSGGSIIDDDGGLTEIYTFSVSISSVNDVVYTPNGILVSLTFSNNTTDVYYVGYKLVNGQYQLVCEKNQYVRLYNDIASLAVATTVTETRTNPQDFPITVPAVNVKTNAYIIGVRIENDGTTKRFYLGKAVSYLYLMADTLNTNESYNEYYAGFELNIKSKYFSSIEVYFELTAVNSTTEPSAGNEQNYVEISESIAQNNLNLPNSNLNLYRFVIDLNQVKYENTTKFKFYFSRYNTSFFDFFSNETTFVFYVEGDNSNPRILREPSLPFSKVGQTVNPLVSDTYYKSWTTATLHKGRLIVSDGSGKLYFSEVNEYALIPDGNFIIVPLGETERIVKLLSKDDDIVIFRTGGIDIIRTGDSIYEAVYRKIYDIAVDNNRRLIVQTPFGITFQSGDYLYLWNTQEQPFPLNWQIADGQTKFRDALYSRLTNELFLIPTNEQKTIYRFSFNYFTSIKGRIAYPVFKFTFDNSSGVVKLVSYEGNTAIVENATSVSKLTKSTSTNGEFITHNLLPPSNVSYIVKNLKVDLSDSASIYITVMYDKFSVSYSLVGSSVRIPLRSYPTKKFKVLIRVLSSSNVSIKSVVYEVQPVATFKRSYVS